MCQEYTWVRYAHGHAQRTKLSLYKENDTYKEAKEDQNSRN
jgi:hypothetical protein